MQTPGGSVPQPEAILEWLQQEMGYRPHGRYLSSNKPLPSPEDLKKICRGNMLPVWNFLLQRVRSEKTVEKIKRNILVHGSPSIAVGLQEGAEAAAKNLNVKEEEVKGKSRKRYDGRSKGKVAEVAKAKEPLEKGHASEAYETRERAMRERDAAEKEVERLRHVLQRQRKELKGRMLEASREEAERKRMLDEKSNYRHKQVMLEAYDQRCEETCKIFAEYQRRLHRYVDQARDAQRVRVGSGQDATPDILRARNEQDTVYATIKGNKPADGLILIETAQERSIRKACESLAAHLTERIRNTFPAYDGGGVQGHAHLDAEKLVIDLDGEMPNDVKDVALNLLRSPPQLLRAITTYTSRIVNLINRETEKIDVRADAERLRYKYENNRIMDASSPDGSSYAQGRSNGNNKLGTDPSNKGTYKQLRERQKAHVQQFMATEDALNKAAEARKASEKLIKRMHGSDDGDAGYALTAGDNVQSAGGLRQFELEVLSKERQLAGLRASVNTLTSELQRLKKMCAEWKEAEDALRKKWKKIEEFDARRTELESVYTALVRANLAIPVRLCKTQNSLGPPIMQSIFCDLADISSGNLYESQHKTAAASWEQHPLAAREYSANTIIPASIAVQSKGSEAHDLIEKEVAAFHRSPDNRLYMLPATPQALLDSMGVSGSTGPEAVAAAEKNAELLTARAGARDPSAIPSICRISAALQYHAGLEGSDAGLASVLESLEFCLKLRGSEASILEDLSKAINQVHMLQDLVGSGRALLSNAYSSQPEYERTASFCLSVAAEQERVAMEKWLPELKAAVHEAQKCLEDCKRVRGLTAAASWEQHPLAAREYSANTIIPASIAVQSKGSEAHDLIEKEVAAFHRSPDNRLYMLPATPQALLDSMGVSGSTGPEAVAAAEKNAELLTARAGARDPSAIPSICRISAALQYHAGLEGSDAGLASVLESLEFCLKLRGSEASILEDLSKAINQVHMLQDLVGSGRALLSNAYSSQPEYERTASFCLSVAAEQERVAMEKWLPELKAAVHEAQKCLEDCKRVRGLVDEWWEQPAATAVDWITVDGQNVATWLAHVKQLQMAFYDKQLL